MKKTTTTGSVSTAKTTSEQAAWSPGGFEVRPVEDIIQRRQSAGVGADNVMAQLKRQRSGEGPEAPVQRKAVSGSVGSGGQAMPAEVQAKMESAFDADFSSVRVHQGPQASAIGARAYAQGTDIHFAPGEYQPGSRKGQALLGHELTHVVQQSQGRVQAPVQAKGAPINKDPGLEQEADVLGQRAADGVSVSASLGAPGPYLKAGQGPVQKDEKDTPEEFIAWMMDQEVFKQYASMGAKGALGQCDPAAQAIGGLLEGAGFDNVRYRGIVAFDRWPSKRQQTITPKNGSHYAVLVDIGGQTMVVDATQQQFQGGQACVLSDGSWKAGFGDLGVFSIGRGAEEYLNLPKAYGDFGDFGAAVDFFKGHKELGPEQTTGTALGPDGGTLDELYPQSMLESEDEGGGGSSSSGGKKEKKKKKGFFDRFKRR